MKNSLTHHQYYQLCCFLEETPGVETMSIAELSSAILAQLQFTVTTAQIERSFESTGISRITSPTDLELAIKALCHRTGMSFGTLVAEGRILEKKQRESFERLSKSSQEQLPLGDQKE